MGAECMLAGTKASVRVYVRREALGLSFEGIGRE